MQSPIASMSNSIGYVSSFVEIFVWLMTIPAYTSLWELLYPSINPYAWGYDFWYDGYARDKDKSSRGKEGKEEEEGRRGREVRRHKMGIMSGMIVIHQQSRSSNSNSNSSTSDKYPVHLQKKNGNNDNGRTDNAGDTAISNIYTYIHSFSCICHICVSSHKS